MIDNSDYRGCRIFIHDDVSQKTIAETVITEYSKVSLVITVDSLYSELKEYQLVTVIILNSNCIYEYKGVLRKQPASSLTEIALFKGKTKESRTSKRYSVNTPAKVETLVIANRLVSLPDPLEALVLNISTKGALIKTSSALNIGTTFQLIMSIGNKETILNTSVVRMNYIDAHNTEYGCKFNYICG